MKLSDYVAQRLAYLGCSDCFAVTGGGAMHLNDSFGECEQISCWYMHHEQSAAMAAEGYARIAGRPAIVNVTTGPGAINSLNGVFGAYTDSIPMIVVAGQVRVDTIAKLNGMSGLRQLGDQEVDSISMVTGITKYQTLISSAESIVDELDKAYWIAISGRPGPVWIEIPVNIQGATIDANPTANFDSNRYSSADFASTDTQCKEIIDAILASHRPVLLAGSGLRIAGVQEEFVHFAEMMNVPVVTAWTHDVIHSEHRLCMGRAGSIGTRPGNIIIQNADLVVVFGSRLNIRQVSYNWESFARNAKVIWIDIDEYEFKKPYSREAQTYTADLKDFIPRLVRNSPTFDKNDDRWIEFCHEINAKYEPKHDDYISTAEGINAYHLIPKIFEVAKNDAIFACGNATACIVPFQVGKLKENMRLFSNSGSASMGYDLPAALGASVANPNRQVVCFAGDGSLMMNLQELETLRNWNCNIKLVVLDNDGYLSIKQTQQNFFGHDHGASPKSGVTFPNFTKIAEAFNLKAVELDPNGHWEQQVETEFNSNGPVVIVAPLETSQEFVPRLKSKIVDGIIRTPELDDMFPHLDNVILEQIREMAATI